MIDLNRSLLSLVATLVILTAGLFVSSAAVGSAQESSTLRIANLDPETRYLTFRGKLGDSTPVVIEKVFFGSIRSKWFDSYTVIYNCKVYDDDGNLYADLRSTGTDGDIALFGEGKYFGIDSWDPLRFQNSLIIVMPEKPDSTHPRLIRYDPSGNIDTLHLSGRLFKEYDFFLGSESTFRFDGHKEWWVMQSYDGSLSEYGNRKEYIVASADTIIAGHFWAGKPAISTRVGTDSIEYRTVNTTLDTNLTLRVDDERAVAISPMTVSSVTSRISAEKETRFRLLNGPAIILDTTFVVRPFQFLNFTIGHDTAGEIEAVIIERLTTRVIDKFLEYWEDSSRVVLFGSLGREYPNARGIKVWFGYQKIQVEESTAWYSTGPSSALVLEDDRSRAIVTFDIRNFRGMKRTYIFDADLEGSHVYHYDEFNLSEQDLGRHDLQPDTFSVAIIAFCAPGDSAHVEIDSSGEITPIPGGTTGVTRTDLLRPPTPIIVWHDSGLDDTAATGAIPGMDGGRTILVVDQEEDTATLVSFIPVDDPDTYGIDLVNITHDYQSGIYFDSQQIIYPPERSARRFAEIEEGAWGFYHVVGKVGDTIATFEVDSMNNRFIVIVDGSREEGELRVYILMPEQIGTGEPLVPTNIFRFETTDVPEEPEYQLDLSSEQPRVSAHPDP